MNETIREMTKNVKTSTTVALLSCIVCTVGLFVASFLVPPLGVIDGFTPEQRFFLAYAGVWASNVREEAKLMLTAADVHSLAENRVNATLPHVTEFIDAWGIKEGDKMYLAPENRAKLW